MMQLLATSAVLVVMAFPAILVHFAPGRSSDLGTAYAIGAAIVSGMAYLTAVRALKVQQAQLEAFKKEARAREMEHRLTTRLSAAVSLLAAHRAAMESLEQAGYRNELGQQVFPGGTGEAEAWLSRHNELAGQIAELETEMRTVYDGMEGPR